MNKKGRLNLRLEPYIWDALNILADKEHRSVNNMVELLVLKQSEFMEIDIESLKEKAREGA